MQEKRSKHAVHKIQYHLVWCTKFRKQVLTGPVEVAAKNIVAQTCADNNWEVVSLEVMPDHVHLLVRSDHMTAPVDIARTLKSISAVHLFTRFHGLKGKKFWGTGMWSPSTFYGTVGDTDEKVVKNYVDNQHKK